MQTWQQQLQQAFKTPQALLTYLEIPNVATSICPTSHDQFMTKVPMSFAKRMQKNNLNDPLLKQVLPITAEQKHFSDYVVDPLQEKQFNHIPGLLHKYHGRILITLTGTCAINCRYCFRRHFDYQNNNIGQAKWQNIFDYIQQNSDIEEVILSGGDPLMVPDNTLHKFTEKLAQLNQIKTLRIHTRLPIVLPARIDDSFVHWTKQQPFKLVIVVHSNHPNEINDEVALAMQRLSNITLLNQSVLLKEINDAPSILATLSRKLFAINILPYYLHQLDKVQGTQHFAVTDQQALQIHQQLQALLPGYLVPRLVKEIPGEKNKTILLR